MKYIISNDLTIEFFVENEKKAIGHAFTEENISIEFENNIPEFPFIIDIKDLKLSNPNFYHNMEIKTLWCKLDFLINRRIVNPELVPDKHKQIPSINKFWKLKSENIVGEKYILFTDDCEKVYNSTAYITANIYVMNDDGIIENQIGTILIKLPDVTFYHEFISSDTKKED